MAYCWRKAPGPDGLQHSKSLPASGVLQVIEDALSVVRNLEGRYLWVDRYCIDHEDLSSKHHQIQNKDKIYEGAIATVVAVANEGSEPGLHGVGPAPGNSQYIMINGNKILISTLPHVSKPLRSSVWMARGWTYQEALVSWRRLFFTKFQVYYVCRTMSWKESVETPIYPEKCGQYDNDQATSVMSLEMFDYKANHSVWNRDPARMVRKLEVFAAHLRQYRSRRFKYDYDALNSFKGMLSQSQFYSLWGIPHTN